MGEGVRGGGTRGSRDGRADAAAAAALAILTLAVFGRVLGHDFVGFDDYWYIHDNLAVAEGLTWSGLRLAFTKSYASNWHPLAWVSHMLDVEIFGLDPRGHHAVSLALHAGSTAVLYLALRAMSGRRGPSAFAAALFGIHPLHVESVAWAAERKDVLCGFFWMLTVLAYARYVRAPRVRAYGWVLAACALCLMSKPMGVTLPAALLLLDLWPLRRLGAAPGPEGVPGGALRRMLLEKAPLAALAALAGFFAWVAQAKGGALTPLERLPLDARAANAVLSYWGYLGKTVWPAGLSAFYPQIQTRLTDGAVLAGIGGMGAVTWAAWRLRGWAPYVLVGWVWYLVTLLPVIGLVQVGEQAMADRYTYLPLVGPFAALAWGAADAGRRWPGVRRALPWAAGSAVLVLSVATWRQAGYWKDTETLFAHALAVTERNWVAHNNYGVALVRREEFEPALEHFRESLRIFPGHIQAQLNLALALRRLGRQEEAIEAYRRALDLSPNLAKARDGLGTLFEELGRYPEAEEQYRASLKGRDDGVVRQRLGSLLLRQERFAEAVEHFEDLVRRMPALAEPHNSLGVALAGSGRTAEALAQFEEALRLQPDYREARLNLELLLSGRDAEPPGGSR